jgi:hypothetical protein
VNNLDQDIENVLRRAPSPPAPAALKDKLLTDFAVAEATRRSGKSSGVRPASGWLRRWWPALAPAAASLACAAVLTVQQTQIKEIEQRLHALPTTTNVAPSRPVAIPDQPISRNSTGAEDEYSRLTDQAAQLSAEIAKLEQVRAENEELRRKMAAGSGNQLTPDELRKLDEARERADSIRCVNNLKQIGLAVKLWALDHQDVFPTNFLCMSNELNTPKILACPSDTNRVVATSFSSYTDANCSYEFFFGSDLVPDQILTRCPLHGNIGLCDGSVQRGVAKTHPESIVEKDGKLYWRGSDHFKPTH